MSELTASCLAKGESMQVHDVAKIRLALSALERRANEYLGSFGDCSIGVGRYVPGSSPWERHRNGDELLYVMDGSARIEVLEESGNSSVELLTNGSLFVVPQARWHQLTAEDSVSILYVSPSEDGADRQKERPREDGGG
ncbi:MAG TPA: cupin domain-containing protein [Pseudomonadales bacterium]